MSTPEDKLVVAAGEVKGAVVWFKSHQFYAGLLAGAILCGTLVHFFKL